MVCLPDECNQKDGAQDGMEEWYSIQEYVIVPSQLRDKCQEKWWQETTPNTGLFLKGSFVRVGQQTVNDKEKTGVTGCCLWSADKDLRH